MKDQNMGHLVEHSVQRNDFLGTAQLLQGPVTTTL